MLDVVDFRITEGLPAVHVGLVARCLHARTWTIRRYEETHLVPDVVDFRVLKCLHVSHVDFASKVSDVSDNRDQSEACQIPAWSKHGNAGTDKQDGVILTFLGSKLSESINSISLSSCLSVDRIVPHYLRVVQVVDSDVFLRGNTDVDR